MSKKTGWRYTKTIDELKSDLRDQLSNFRRSMVSFDQGHPEEAIRLATSAYTLLDDSGSRSLLGQLDIKKSLQFVSSIRPGIDDFHESLKRATGAGKLKLFFEPPPLCVLTFGNAPVEFVPKFTTSEALSYIRHLKFSEWYKEKAFQPMEGPSLSREGLIRTIRNQDGGGHVDSSLDNEAYYRLAKNVEPSISSTTNNDLSTAKPLDFAHWPSMRQIAWEIDETLKESGL